MDPADPGSSIERKAPAIEHTLKTSPESSNTGALAAWALEASSISPPPS